MRRTHHLDGEILSIGLGVEQVSVAVLGHPMRAIEMAIMQLAGALWLIARIDSEQESNDLVERCPVRFCIQQSRVKLEMLPVILGDRTARRRIIGKVVSARSGHFSPLVRICASLLNASWCHLLASVQRTNGRFSAVRQRRQSPAYYSASH